MDNIQQIKINRIPALKVGMEVDYFFGANGARKGTISKIRPNGNLMVTSVGQLGKATNEFKKESNGLYVRVNHRNLINADKIKVV